MSGFLGGMRARALITIVSPDHFSVRFRRQNGVFRLFTLFFTFGPMEGQLVDEKDRDP
jgi:hypothetical protein